MKPFPAIEKKDQERRKSCLDKSAGGVERIDRFLRKTDLAFALFDAASWFHNANNACDEKKNVKNILNAVKAQIHAIVNVCFFEITSRLWIARLMSQLSPFQFSRNL